MNATEYAPLARRTLKELPREQHFIHMALGLTGEMGEFIDAIKKHVIYGKELDVVNLTEEAGDEFWYGGNLLPELEIPAHVFQRAVEEGYEKGLSDAQKDHLREPFAQATVLLGLNVAVAQMGFALASQPDRFAPSSSGSAQLVETLGNVLGALCGYFGLDPALAMELNIKKLAKRYGDKYSDVAALNRDTDAERDVLEQKAQ